MAKQTRTKKAGEKTTRKKTTKKGMTTKELTDKHMNDEHHNITDDEIRNVQIDLDVETGEALELPEGEERPHEVDKDRKFQTPWDVINES